MTSPFWRRPLPWAYFYAVFGIIAANLGVYLLNQVAPDTKVLLAMNPVFVLEGGQFWQVLTYMYVHSDFGHILFNMLGLFFFGMALEERMGSWEFLAFYHVTGLLAGIFSLVVYAATGQTYVWLMGASGAVFAVLLAFAAFNPQARILLFFVIPIKAPVLVILYTSFELFSQILNPYSGVAHLTHLAGFLFAFVYLLVRFRLNAWLAFWRRG